MENMRVGLEEQKVGKKTPNEGPETAFVWR